MPEDELGSFSEGEKKHINSSNNFFCVGQTRECLFQGLKSLGMQMSYQKRAGFLQPFLQEEEEESFFCSPAQHLRQDEAVEQKHL